MLRPLVRSWRRQVAEKKMLDAMAIQIPDCRVGPGSLVVDLGANRGRFSHLMAATGARVLAFEPMPIAAKVARRQLRKFPNATLYEVAISDRAGIETLYLPPGFRFDPLGYSISASLDSSKPNVTDSSSLSVATLPLGTLLDSVGPVDLMKVDIEGSELKIWPELVSRVNQIQYLLMELHSYNGELLTLRAQFAAFVQQNGLQGRWSADWL